MASTNNNELEMRTAWQTASPAASALLARRGARQLGELTWLVELIRAVQDMPLPDDEDWETCYTCSHARAAVPRACGPDPVRGEVVRVVNPSTRVPRVVAALFVGRPPSCRHCDTRQKCDWRGRIPWLVGRQNGDWLQEAYLWLRFLGQRPNPTLEVSMVPAGILPPYLEESREGTVRAAEELRQAGVGSRRRRRSRGGDEEREQVGEDRARPAQRARRAAESPGQVSVAAPASSTPSAGGPALGESAEARLEQLISEMLTPLPLDAPYAEHAARVQRAVDVGMQALDGMGELLRRTLAASIVAGHEVQQYDERLHQAMVRDALANLVEIRGHWQLDGPQAFEPDSSDSGPVFSDPDVELRRAERTAAFVQEQAEIDRPRGGPQTRAATRADARRRANADSST
ncbi:uncharacterized protein SRS1_10703 [Sporisorium reilianum f. sp. reilianum]|uniref:Uncharacterized protein n=1 Tax=Sporisorium reilianum f. sp. reilianum TaxID=72559 RepID=A0A2N8UCK3_9BASI|nr:uncharacterized protein SRS1_10703 [Sporisorium reilianum f. sp. reilianum]